MIAVCKVCEKKFTIPDGDNASEYKCPCGGDLREDVKESKVFRMPGKDNKSPLISCPDCGRTVSRRAAYCPNCGGMVAGLTIPFVNMIQISFASVFAALVIGVIGFTAFGIFMLIANALK